MEKQSWQDEAVKESGIKVPEWELEGTGTEQKEVQEGGIEEMPSAAEARMAELAAETQVATPEKPEEKAAQAEVLRAEIAEMAKPAEQEAVKVEAPAIKPINMEDVRFGAPQIEASYFGSIPFVNSSEFTPKAAKEASGGMIEYVPNSKQNKYGFEFEGGGKIPPEKLAELEAKLTVSEDKKSREAFEYVTSGAEFEEDRNLQLGNSRAFTEAINAKASRNEKSRTNFFKKSVYASSVPITGGIASIAIGGAGSTAAALGGLALLGGGGGLIALGALGWGAKRIYDRYKEKKAIKNYMTASVAQNMRRSLKSTQ